MHLFLAYKILKKPNCIKNMNIPMLYEPWDNFSVAKACKFGFDFNGPAWQPGAKPRQSIVVTTTRILKMSTFWNPVVFTFLQICVYFPAEFLEYFDFFSTWSMMVTTFQLISSLMWTHLLENFTNGSCFSFSKHTTSLIHVSFNPTAVDFLPV